MHQRQRGFTLTELAVVFTIVALVLASAMYTFSAQVENRNIVDTQRSLNDAREMLLAYAIVNGRLPCPASSTSNGDESPASTGVCTDGYTGFLPARALGYSPVDSAGYALDAWGNRIRYAVSVNSSVTGAPDYSFTTPSAIRTNFISSAGVVLTPSDLLICPSSEASAMSTSTSTPTCGTISSQSLVVTNQNTVAAVIWSQGKNFTSATYSGVSGQSGPDEAFNNKTSANSNHGVFIYRSARSFQESNPFDDQMVWIPASLLYSRMIAAGQLP